MKYRVRTTASEAFPYKVERKSKFLFINYWRQVSEHRNLSDAESAVRTSVKRYAKAPVGTVVFEYDDADLIAETLKRHSIPDGPQAATNSYSSIMDPITARIRSQLDRSTYKIDDD